MTRGQAVTVSGEGFGAFATLALSFHSDVVDLGLTTSDGAGRFQATVRIPAEATPGRHQIVVSGADRAGVVREAGLDVVVVVAPGPPDRPLVRTGSDDAALLALVLVLWAGGSLLLRAARRRPREHRSQ